MDNKSIPPSFTIYNSTSCHKSWEIRRSSSIALILLLHAFVNAANIATGHATSASEAAGGVFFYVWFLRCWFFFFGWWWWSTLCICNVLKVHRTNQKTKTRKGRLPRGGHGFGPNGVPWNHMPRGPWPCLEKLVGIFRFFFFWDHEFMILKKSYYY